MTTFRLNYLFYVGIILPTVVTLALFVFFVICWRKQSARKAVLTKPYDPHGTMRRLGIPNTPPPPPLFLRRGLTSSSIEHGGEDNAAYDMSRSPSAEANSGKATRPTQLRTSPSGDLDATARQLRLLCSPPGELEMAGRLAFHSRLDSGLSESACDSPAHGAGAGCGGGGGGAASRDRPQSQASHSSHSTDSEDSGFRSSRSGHLTQPGHHEPPVLRRSRSTGRGKGRGYYTKAATSSPDSDTEPSLPLTPTALWSQHGYRPPSCQHRYQAASADHQTTQDTVLRHCGGEVHDVDTHVGWKYLQDLASPGHKAREKGTDGGGSELKQALTCHQSMTLAQVHTSSELENPDVLGFSVV